MFAAENRMESDTLMYYADFSLDIFPYGNGTAVLYPHAGCFRGQPFIAASGVMREKAAMCQYLSQSDVPVLIIGEVGTGKQTLARRIYLTSSRAEKPFIHVKCSETSVEALAAVLFGDNTGQFEADCFERADGGTVFLEEITALPLSIQAKLLERLTRVLSEDTVQSNKRPVRLITSTVRDIEQLTASGAFLVGLYQCINVLPIYLPPLHRRTEDITPLAYLFLRKFSREMNKPFTCFSDEALSSLHSAAWGGNICELKNAVEHGCIVGTPPIIQDEDIFAAAGYDFFHDNPVYNMKTAVDFFKRYYILSVLEHNAWNQTAAASVLGIQRTYLSRLMKELKINRLGNNYGSVSAALS